MKKSTVFKVSRLVLCLGFLAGLPAACSGGDMAQDGSEQGSFGRVSLALTTVTNNTTYRLAGATFVIDGPTPTVLSSVDDPDVTVLTTELATGNYLSTLQGGWTLERYNGVAFVPVEATLVSANPANFGVTDGEVTNLVYQFQTDGTIISIGVGWLNVSIAVDEIGGACTPFGEGCDSGSWCAPANVMGPAPACTPIGPRQVGDFCSGVGQCTTHAICALLGEGQPTCVALCPLSNAGMPCPTGGSCSDTVSPDFGVCM